MEVWGRAMWRVTAGAEPSQRYSYAWLFDFLAFFGQCDCLLSTVQQALDNLMQSKKRTTIVVAHR